MARKQSRRSFSPSSLFKGRRSRPEVGDRGASALARRAGQAWSPLEELEARKLLAITIGPGDVDPATGLGTVTGFWPYVVPWLRADIPAETPLPVTNEEFADETDPWATLNPAIPPSGTFFSQSQIQISYTPTGAVPQLEVGFPQPGDPQGDRDLKIALSANGTVTIRFFEGADAGNPLPRLTQRSSFNIGQSFAIPSDNTGLDTSGTGTKVELLRAGVVVATFSGAQLAALGTPAQGAPGDTRFDFNFDPGYDAVRFSSAQVPPDNASYTDNFRIDNIQATFPSTRFAQFISDRTFYAVFTFTGPVGASFSAFDLTGTEAFYGLFAGIPENGTLPIIDLLGTGIPQAGTDGIRDIVFTGTNTRTTFTLIGGTWDDTIQDTALPIDPGGFMDDLEQVGFGFALTNDTPPQVIGLPNDGASIVIGSPWIRDRTNTGTYYQNVPLPGGDDFIRPDQGFRVNGGASIGSIQAHAIVMGSSTFSGAVGRYATGLQLGSTTVQGDLGAMFVAGEAGIWARDDNNPAARRSTRALLTVGRTLGQLHIGGRSLMGVNVIGDINNTSRPRVDLFNYNEQEVIYGYDPQTQDGPRTTLAATLNRGTLASTQGVIFGGEYFRNDSILSAEWVGGQSAGAIIRGTLGQQDPVNTGEDAADVYAFAADVGGEVVVSVEVPGGDGQFVDRALARIMDQDGRVIASNEFVENSRAATPGRTGVRVAFKPDHADVYYLVIGTPNDGDFGSSLAYEATITGLSPTTFGMHRVGAGLGDTASPTLVSVQSGSMGSFRLGTGYVGGDGGEKDTFDLQNHDDDIDDNFNWRASTLSVPGNLYGILTGSDVGAAQIFIGGKLGRFVTGLSNLVGTGPAEGDLNTLDLNVGGTIGVLDIRGAISWEQDPTGPGPAGPVFIRTGTTGGNGSIGSILVGAFVNSERDGSGFVVRTSNGSTINQFQVGVTGGNGGQNGDLTRGTPRFTLGTGSDLRFADFDIIASATDPNAFRQVNPGTPVILSDDTGTSVVIEIRGGTAGSNAQVRFLPIDGSQGVAIGRITATLNGGAELRITGTGPGTASIGRIVVTTDGAAAGGVITITGTAQVDVGRIDHIAGTALALIQNNTPGGDIVAIDATGLTRLVIAGGNLGRTQTNGVGPALLGPDLGIQGGAGQAVGGPMGVTAAGINPNWSGAIFTPVNAATADPGQETLEDLGSPINGRLNGLIVRTGNVTEVNVVGAVGDVILQGTGAVLTTLRANSDGVRAFAGAFEGIVGVVYATDIGTVEIGDGLDGPGPSPFAQAGIFADDDIQTVAGGRGLNPVIRGLVIANNQNADAGPNTNGLINISLTGGRFDDARIGATLFDWFWNSARYQSRRRDEAAGTGEIVGVSVVNGDLFRTEALAVNIQSVLVSGGAYDASWFIANGDVGVIQADEFRNTTRLGEATEFRRNQIDATRNIARIIAAGGGGNGDISDLVIDAQGSLTGTIVARNTARFALDVDQTVQDLSISNDIRSTTITAGTLIRAFAGGDIRSTRFDIAGPIVNIIAANSMTSVVINNTGPDGRIDLVQARFFITGTISSSGPITNIISTEGDIIADISTTEADGTLNNLQAGNDLLVTLDIASDVNRIFAGRNVGAQFDSPGARAINVRGSLNTIEAQRGQVYTDVTVGQGINGYVRNARVVALPGNDLVSRATIRAFGRIALIDINGDLNGSIISESGGIGLVRINNGSFRPGNQIRANDGGIDQVLVQGGHLMGDVIAEEFITLVRVTEQGGFWGDIGVNANYSQFQPFDQWRNTLPPGVAQVPTFQGARIQAGTNIGTVEVLKGSFWESSIVAGHSITRVFIFGVILNDYITPGLGGSFIVAGDSIDSVEVGQFAGGAIIGAGVAALGADNRPGGVGANADTVRFGRINSINFKNGSAYNSIFAGLDAGADGFYTLNPGPDNTRGTADDINDDKLADGLSVINNFRAVNGNNANTVYADNGIGTTSAGTIKGGPGLGQQNPGRVIEFVPATGRITNGVATPFTTPAGETGRITFTGPGQAYYNIVFNASLGRNVAQLAIINSNANSRLVVDTDQNSLTDFQTLSNDGASIGSADIRANMNGASSFFYDGYVQFLRFGFLNTTGLIGAGNDVGSLIFGPVTRANIFANYIGSIIDGGDFGLLGESGEAVLQSGAIGTVQIFGSHHGLLSSDRDITSVIISGQFNRGQVRAGRSITTFSSGSMTEARLGVGNNISSLVINGSVTDSDIYAGTDLGTDGQFGGSGTAADVVTNGAISSVNITGNFVRSNIAAGISRGADGYLGTPDDVADEGRSSIGPVTIGGQAVGSLLGSQSYRIVSTGSLGQVRAAGLNFVQNGNLAIETLGATSLPVQVGELAVEWVAGVFTAVIPFNQPIDSSTLSSALRVSEIRSGGAVQIFLAENSDYSVSYDALSNTARVRFSQAVTSRSLPVTPGLPGPGTYRFVLQQSVLRGQTQGQLLDGNGDGFAAPGDDFSQDAIVGDAGDKLADAAANSNGTVIDFRAASDLDQVLDANQAADNLPDANRSYTLRGVIGDHPDQDINNFRSGGDADLYKITLRAGQILRLGAMQGNAQLAGRAIMDANGVLLAANTAGGPGGGTTDPVRRLASKALDVAELSTEDNYLITRTGVYLLLVTPFVGGVNVADGTAVANIPGGPGTTGDYRFTLEVFDDGDTGFAGDTDSGDGTNVVNAPTPIEFAGTDGVLGTGDDLPSITIGGFTFTYSRGPDGRVGTPGNLPAAADDLVTGSNNAGITSQRTAGANRLFGDSDDQVISYIAASIGDPNAAGSSVKVQPDVDIFHLNNRNPIVPGTVVRVTLDLTELGANLGLTENPLTQGDLRGDVQLAIFDSSGASNVSDALLYVSSSDLKAVGGQPGRVFSFGANSYGYDAEGNFFIQFITTGRLGVAGNAPASYAVYVQGATQSDYSVRVLTQGTASIIPINQNIVLETRGGTINWLEAGRGVSTALNPFTTAGIGFTGLVGNLSVDDYVLNNVFTNLNNIFAAANINIILSTTPATFQGQEFSTVFLSGSNEPASFFNNGTFGASQHADSFNTDHNDQAVVFVPSLGVLGYGPDQVGIDNLVKSLTGAVARRIGEITGLRALENVGAGLAMAADSVTNIPGGNYNFSGASQRLSSNFDSLFNTNFYLGNQNDTAILNRTLNPRF